MIQKTRMIYETYEKPPFSKGILLSFQHVFAMFGATILVPLILGLSVSTALLASGIGTLVFLTVTQFKMPVYLGSSFAYISAMAIAKEQLGGDISAAQTGIMLVGLVYMAVAGIIAISGSEWLTKLLPPIVIGPMIIVIGLGLAGSAVTNAGFVENTNWREVVAALVTFMTAALINVRGRGFIKVIPFLIAIIVGYIVAVFLGIVDFEPVLQADWVSLPDFSLPFATSFAKGPQYHLYFGPEALAIIPIAFVTIAEHMGDVMVLSEITDHKFMEEPGIHRSIFGDGLASLISAFIGGPANTTYGENTGVVGLTRTASVSVIRNAAIIAIALSFLGKFTAMISTIPASVLGGMSILLYGVSASNGLKVLIKDQTDFNNPRNLIIASAMLVIGLGGAVLELGTALVLSGTALSALVGVILNLILPEGTPTQD